MGPRRISQPPGRDRRRFERPPGVPSTRQAPPALAVCRDAPRLSRRWPVLPASSGERQSLAPVAAALLSGRAARSGSGTRTGPLPQSDERPSRGPADLPPRPAVGHRDGTRPSSRRITRGRADRTVARRRRDPDPHSASPSILGSLPVLLAPTTPHLSPTIQPPALHPTPTQRRRPGARGRSAR